MKHLRRCPATKLCIVNGQLQGSDRCQRPASHDESHHHDGFRWVFTEGSYSGIAEDHPEYNKIAERR